MITVSILINGQPLYTRSAVNVTEKENLGTYGKGRQTYRLDTGKLVFHSFEDGAVKLAQKMLKSIKEL